MPLMTRKKRKEVTVKAEESFHPEIVFKVPVPGKKDVHVYVVEDPPRIRYVRCRQMFQDGNYHEFHIQKPWSYYLVRANENGTVYLTALFFATHQLKSLKEEGLRGAPLPNVDYGRDKGLGVCLWKETTKHGIDGASAAVFLHTYFWTSDFNPGVSYYDEGRPAVIAGTGHQNKWLSSLSRWNELTKEKKEIEWVPVSMHKNMARSVLFGGIQEIRDGALSKAIAEWSPEKAKVLDGEFKKLLSKVEILSTPAVTLEQAILWMNETQDYLYT